MASPSSCSGDITVSSSNDAEALADCTTYDGNIVISDNASGTIQINGVTSISGDLRAENATQLTSLSGDQLNSVGGTLSLSSLDILSALQFPSLQSVNSLSFSTLPALQNLNFGSGISRANSISIFNTALTSLDGIDLEAFTDFYAYGNPYLTSIDMNALSNVTRSLSILANAENLTASFPNLESAANITVANVSTLSIPSIASIAGWLVILSSQMETFSAPNLTTIGNDLFLGDNPRLTGLVLPELQTIGGRFNLLNNSQLHEINSMNSLKNVAGAIDFQGTFDNITFPALTDVRGGANVESSTTDSALCDSFNRAASRGIIKGDVTCKTNVSNDNTDGSGSGSTSGGTSGGSTTDTGGGSSGLGAGAIAGIVVGALAIIAAITLFWWLRKRKQRKQSQAKPGIPDPRPGHHQLPLGGHHEKAELHGGINQVSELAGEDTQGRREAKPGAAEMSASGPIEVREAELASSSAATNVETHSTTHVASATQSDRAAGLTPAAGLAGSGAQAGRRSLDQPEKEVFVGPPPDRASEQGVGRPLESTTTDSPQAQPQPGAQAQSNSMHPAFLSQLRDLDRELDEGLITRKGYDARRDGLFKQYLSSSSGGSS